MAGGAKEHQEADQSVGSGVEVNSNGRNRHKRPGMSGMN